MTKPKTRIISGPFDVKHVGGVSIPGTTNPLVGIERSRTSVLEPDETPSHTFVAHGNVEIPRRSNTIASNLRKPSLRLQTSISRLRGRSISHSPDKFHRKDTPEPADAHPQNEMLAQSLRKKPSSSRLWQRVHDAGTKEHSAKHKEPMKISAPEPTETEKPALKLKTSMALTNSQSTTSSPEHYTPPQRDTTSTTSTTSFLQRQPSLKFLRQPSQKPLPPVRPKRADSGTAIDFDNVPVDERPLGFKEILAVQSFSERMALYKKTREYWAKADHGLGEWVAKTGGQQRLAFEV